nr:transporter substrate-binding domain-containing protein [Pseudomonas sp. 2FG]
MVRVAHGLLLLALSFFAAQSLLAAQVVKVGAYHFPPYAIKPESAQPQGLLPDLLKALNQQQTEYRFELVMTSVTRRFRDFENGRFDIILFESPSWGWQNIPLTSVDLQIEDAELYVARAESEGGQDYFNQLSGKRLALYSGYHYGFANYNADPDYLIRHFNAVLTYSHDSNLLMVLRGRADVTVVTRSYLHHYQQLYPERRSQMLVSTRVDQTYHHQALLRPQSVISAATFTALLQQLRAQGQLGKLLGHYQLNPSTQLAEP